MINLNRQMQTTLTILILATLFVGCGGSSNPLTGTGIVAGLSTTDVSMTTPGGSKLICEEAQFAQLVNLYRVSQGLNVLEVSLAGTVAARWHANDMFEKNYFSHNEPNGRTWSQRMNSFGYPGWSENIVYARTFAKDAFCAFKNSAGHNANMLGSGHISMSIGMVKTYWSNGYGPKISDAIALPLTSDSDCVLPTQVPSC